MRCAIHDTSGDGDRASEAEEPCDGACAMRRAIHNGCIQRHPAKRIWHPTNTNIVERFIRFCSRKAKLQPVQP